MGLFSKQTYVCARCGETFESRIASENYPLCSKCQQELMDLEKQIKGYKKYAGDMGLGWSDKNIEPVAAHKQEILLRRGDADGIFAELQAIGENFKKAGQDEINYVNSALPQICIDALGGNGIAINDRIVTSLAYDDEILSDDNEKVKEVHLKGTYSLEDLPDILNALKGKNIIINIPIAGASPLEFEEDSGETENAQETEEETD